VILVCYDIPDDRRRKKVAKALAGLGRRVQYSVFLVHRAGPADIASALSPLLRLAEDDVRIHPLCGTCEPKAVLLGRAREVNLPEGFRIL
jgi:CRISPR-associated protein Cas2